MPEPELCVLDRGMIEQCVAAFDPLDVVASVLQSHANSDTVLPAEASAQTTTGANGRAHGARVTRSRVVRTAPPPGRGALAGRSPRSFAVRKASFASERAAA